MNDQMDGECVWCIRPPFPMVVGWWGWGSKSRRDTHAYRRGHTTEVSNRVRPKDRLDVGAGVPRGMADCRSESSADLASKDETNVADEKIKDSHVESPEIC